ncbi:hypothetical protein WCLP8_5090008 [uncultured Gammaproteobacteria bacterium]
MLICWTARELPRLRPVTRAVMGAETPAERGKRHDRQCTCQHLRAGHHGYPSTEGALARVASAPGILLHQRFGSEELDILLTGTTETEGGTEADEDSTPELPVEAISRPGDLWLLGNHLAWRHRLPKSATPSACNWPARFLWTATAVTA